MDTFNIPVTEIIKMRHSVRSYQNTEIPSNLLEKLQAYIKEINNTKGLFGGSVRIELVKKADPKTEVKLGTYGVIKGASHYLVVACENNKYNLEDLGFLFEQVILYCTSLGLGSVWIGGTFQKSNFSKAIHLKENEILPIISPIGIENEKQSILAKMFGTNSFKRKDFNQICFNQDFDTPLNYEEANEYKEVLDMVRLAPSAMNKKPWRIKKEGNNFHIYSDSKIKMSRIDIGICMCHFYLTAKEKKLKGEIKVLRVENYETYKYVASWVGYPV